MLIGGSAATNDDHGWLLAHERRNTTWSCPKHARVGDQVFNYIVAPVSQVLATARVITKPRPGHEIGSVWRYVGRIGSIRLLRSPIPLSELKELCPNWAWLRYPRAYAYIPDRDARMIKSRATQRVRELPTPIESNQRAGFGCWEDNRRVEKAAVAAVARHYRSKGYVVESRETECIGYDLDVRKGRLVLHVEVKGISNEFPSFPITANEVRRAESDDAFRLAIVTSALAPRDRRIRILKGTTFLRDYSRTALPFMAVPS
jgi:hypothetical protein